MRLRKASGSTVGARSDSDNASRSTSKSMASAPPKYVPFLERFFFSLLDRFTVRVLPSQRPFWAAHLCVSTRLGGSSESPVGRNGHWIGKSGENVSMRGPSDPLATTRNSTGYSSGGPRFSSQAATQGHASSQVAPSCLFCFPMFCYCREDRQRCRGSPSRSSSPAMGLTIASGLEKNRPASCRLISRSNKLYRADQYQFRNIKYAARIFF